MSLVTNEDQFALQTMVAQWVTRSGAGTARRDVADRRPDGAASRWSAIAEMGFFGIHLPAAVGGAAGSLADLAVVVAEFGRALLPGPFVPTVIVSAILSHCVDQPEIRSVLTELAIGVKTASVVLDPDLSVSAANTLNGIAGLSIAGDTADLLIVGSTAGSLTRWFLVDSSDTGVHCEPLKSMDITRTLAQFTFDGVTPIAELTGIAPSLVRDLATVLFAAEAAGIGRWCLDTAVGYAMVRRQFGQLIGSFQAVKHICAEMAVTVETIAAATWDGVSCADDEEQLRLTAAAAGSLAIDGAVSTAKSCIQLLGGIGYTWEHDAHLYLRRAMTVRLILGASDTYSSSVTSLVLAGSRRILQQFGEGTEVEVRTAVREFAKTLIALPENEQRAALVTGGYLVPSWPRPYGLGADLAQALAINSELVAVGVQVPDLVIGGWLVRAVVDHGTDEQREKFVPPTLRGDIKWCQLFSEPEAGSDLASLRMRAVRVAGGWQLNGQKVWTSEAVGADWGFCLARTDPEAPKHRGITAFLIDMAAPGIDIRPLREMTGHALFNEVFLTDVYVPDDAVVGQVNNGWRVATSALASERIAMGDRTVLTPSLVSLIDSLGGDPDLAKKWGVALGALLSRAFAKAANDRRMTLTSLAGLNSAALPTVSKLLGVRLSQDDRELAVQIQGPRGAIDEGENCEPIRTFFSSRALSIAGGTTQILLNLLAERVLGLPRG